MSTKEKYVIIEVSFPLKDFSSSNGRGDSEKIPSPSQILSALLSTGEGKNEHVMETLEALETVHPIVCMSMPKGKVTSPVTSVIKQRNSSSAPASTGVSGQLIYEGNLNKGIKGFISAPDSVVHDNSIFYCYDIDESHIPLLQRLSEMVGFLGKATSPTVVKCYSDTLDNILSADKSLKSYFPNLTKGFKSVGFSSNVPNVGYCRHMEEKYYSKDAFYSSMAKEVFYTPFDVNDFESVSFAVSGKFPLRTVETIWKQHGGIVYAKKMPSAIRTKNNYFSSVYVKCNTDDIDKASDIVSTLEALSTVEIEESYYDAREFFGSSTIWESFLPIEISKNSVIAQAKIMAEISRQTGLNFSDFNVEFDLTESSTSPMCTIVFNEEFSGGLAFSGTAFLPVEC